MTPHGHVPEDLYASWSPSLSPDAREVAFVSDRGGQPQIWLRALSGGPLTAVPLDGCRVTAVTWSPTGEWLACQVAPTGRSRLEAWVVRPDGSDARMVAGARRSTAVIARGRSRGWTGDGLLLVTETARTSTVLLLDPATGRRTVLHEGPLTTALDTTPDAGSTLLVRGPRGVRELLVLSGGSLRTVIAGSPDGSSEQGCLSPDGTVVWARSDAACELAALVAVGESGAALSRPGAELEDVALSADGSVAALTWNVDGGLSALTLLDVASGEQREVGRLPRHVVSGVGLSDDGKLLVLTAEGPQDPRGVWFGPAGGPLSPLSSPGKGALHASRGATVEEIDPAEVVAPTLLRLPSADGTEITGWLYRPAGARPVPTVVWLHGGPEAQERPVYSSLFQSLLAEDIAVFAPNVRGSTGFGRSFRTADDRGGRYGAFSDVTACAAYLVSAGIAEPGRLGLLGRSYGGYLTLAVLTRFPELFSVGVAVCGMSDLHTFYAHTEPWIAAAAVPKYGHPVRDAALLRDLSPLGAIEALRAPLLLVHGADDTNVPVSESRQVAAALAARGVPHRLLVFEGEGHELLGAGARVAFVQATLQWVLEHL